MKAGACIFVFVNYGFFQKKNLRTICPGSSNLSFYLHNFVQTWIYLQMWLTSVARANVEAGIYQLNDERRFLFKEKQQKSTLPIHQIIEVSHSEACVNKVPTNWRMRKLGASLHNHQGVFCLVFNL